MKTYSHRFSEVLTTLMQERGISQNALAHIAGVSQASVSNWLSQHKTPSVTSLCLMADYFGVTTDELLGRK